MTTADQKKTVALLFGGCSPEYEVSLCSAAAVLRGLDPARYDVIPVGITPPRRVVPLCLFRRRYRSGALDRETPYPGLSVSRPVGSRPAGVG